MLRTAVLFFGLALAGCPSGSSPPPEPSVVPEPTDIKDPEPTELPPVTEATTLGIAKSINAFGVDFYKRIAAAPGNVVASPASISIAFAMTYAGAEAETAAEMRKTFAFALDGDELFAGFTSTLESWNAAEDVELAVANRLFGEKTFAFKPEFIDLTSTFFRAPLQPMDFKANADGARKEINGWVEERTKTRIKDLLPDGSVDETTRLVLTNAIYFKGDWQLPFAKETTLDGEFRTPSGASQVPMMHQQSSFTYAEDGDVQIVELAYKGGALSMLFVLPRKDNGLAAVEAALTTEKLAQWSQALSNREVNISLPKFRVEPEKSVSLKRTLQKMGLVRVWVAEMAEFGKMAPAPPPLYISDAFHKAFIEVNEKGTEAAAATAVVMAEGSAAPPPSAAPARFNADHPFLFLLQDRKTGALLFIGRVENP